MSCGANNGEVVTLSAEIIIEQQWLTLRLTEVGMNVGSYQLDVRF
jgi:hypothetical protein